MIHYTYDLEFKLLAVAFSQRNEQQYDDSLKTISIVGNRSRPSMLIKTESGGKTLKVRENLAKSAEKGRANLEVCRRGFRFPISITSDNCCMPAYLVPKPMRGTSWRNTIVPVIGA